MIGRRRSVSGHGRRILRWCTLAVWLAGSGAVAPAAHSTPAVERVVYLMGTRVRLVTFDEEPDRAGLRLETFVRSLEETDRELSVWQPDTVLSGLNQQPVGETSYLERHLCRVVDELFRWHRETEGAFDPAVLPLLRAWDLHGRGRVPTPPALAGALRHSGLERVRFSSETCAISRLAEVGIDSGAFGKGEALDRVAALHTTNDAAWMIDLGGQVMVRGRPPHLAGWQVAIAHPTRRDEPAMELTLPGGSLAVSGGSERDVESHGTRIGHILDPRTGRPARFHGSVAVWHERALIADILSTALYVMGPEAGLGWANARNIAVCFLEPVSDSSRVRFTPSAAFTERFAVHSSSQPASSPTVISPESSASANTPPPQSRSMV